VSLAVAPRRPGLARLAAGGLLSETGDWLLLIALPLHVLALTGSSLVTATVFALELVPTVVAAPLAGVLASRGASCGRSRRCRRSRSCRCCGSTRRATCGSSTWSSSSSPCSPR
jgi:hypothetical protein